MSVLEGCHLDEGNRRVIAGPNRGGEVVQVVGMVGRINLFGARNHGEADRLGRGRTEMGRIGSRRKVLEPDVMRDIVGNGATDDLAHGGAGATGGAIVV